MPKNALLCLKLVWSKMLQKCLKTNLKQKSLHAEHPLNFLHALNHAIERYIRYGVCPFSSISLGFYCVMLLDQSELCSNIYL